MPRRKADNAMRFLLLAAPLILLVALCKPDDNRDQVVPSQGMTEWDRINLERNLRWILARERVVGDARVARVGVFADAGVWHVGARSIVEALESQGVACRVLDRTKIRVEELARFDAIVLPGGWAPFQWDALGEPGLAALKKYVESGGRCLGICAGAYLLSRTTQYESKSYPYPLGLFDGTASGPIKGLAPFPKAGEAKLSVTEKGEQRGLSLLSNKPLYYSGGPCFLGGTDVNVLARYSDGSPAAITRKIGKGEVVLIGVHVERPVGENHDAPTPTVAAELLRSLLLPPG
jgi:glutamine amidotransferase-like uncharacterized protein